MGWDWPLVNFILIMLLFVLGVAYTLRNNRDMTRLELLVTALTRTVHERILQTITGDREAFAKTMADKAYEVAPDTLAALDTATEDKVSQTLVEAGFDERTISRYRRAQKRNG